MTWTGPDWFWFFAGLALFAFAAGVGANFVIYALRDKWKCSAGSDLES